jgi:hypothetical protein
MNTSYYHIARVISIILVCGLGVAGTSRGMHQQNVKPYYAQLAEYSAQIEATKKISILKGHIYVGFAQ